jgi:lipid-A-disaccharide synthase
MKIAIVAGEKSGDYLGSELIKAIRSRAPDSEFIGLCGPLMQEQGAQTLGEMDKISIMGLEGLFTALPEIMRIRRHLYKYFIANPPDVFIGIDVPDFNLGLERKLKAKGIPTVHYVSPTVWAWRGGRINKIKRSIDLMLTLFPFEQQFYQQHDIPVKFVGHPLATQVQSWQIDSSFRESLAQDKQTLIALMPGSRMSEVTRLAPMMVEAATALASQNPSLGFVIPTANQRIYQYLVEQLEVDTSLITVLEGQSRDVLSICDLVALASGTAALEAALFAKPMVVVYKMAWLTIFLYKHTVTVEHFSMPNHLTKPPAVRELIQDNATTENLVAELKRLIDQGDYYANMRSALSAIVTDLNQDSSKLATDAIFELVQQSRSENGVKEQ